MLWAFGSPLSFLISFLYFISLLHQCELVLQQEHGNSYELSAELYPALGGLSRTS
ncbi:MAG: hypothetical protein GPOALKHO_000293 [Sodalis sp.]|nr:MAG: hypothetical protein GPOALKHO_000293 [Sodalis sp.]